VRAKIPCADPENVTWSPTRPLGIVQAVLREILLRLCARGVIDR
jgi:hypothetical protein